MASVVKTAIGDAVITGFFVAAASSLGVVASLAIAAAGVRDNLYASLAIMTALLAAVIFLFDVLSAALGGASYNPTGTASFYAAGYGDDSLFSVAYRLPAQALGAVGGVLALLEFAPKEYKHMLAGPTLKVDLHTGALAEGVLTFLISFAVLLIIIRGPASHFVKVLLIAVSSVAVIISGSTYTGPSLNPANAYGWAYISQSHNTWEQFYVYWIGPFIGAILAAWIFRVIFSPPKAKVKKA